MKPIEPCYRLFGMKVEQLRSMLGITQQDLAKRIGVTRTSITNVESGNQRVLLADVERFASALGTTPKHLMRGIWT
jgi:transcriptional regulator with XRE-family HTH domain